QNAQFDQAVREQDAISAVDFAWQRAEGGADPRGVAQNSRSCNDEALTRAQLYWPASGERPGANLRTLQVGENGDWFFLFDGRGAQRGDILRMFRVSAMRKIQPRHIHTSLQQ